MVPCIPVISVIIWKWSIHYTFCQLCSTYYTCTAVQIKNCSKSTSVIKVATVKNTDNFHYTSKGSNHVIPPNRHFLRPAKMNGTHRRTLKSSWGIHYMYCGMPKGILQPSTTWLWLELYGVWFFTVWCHFWPDMCLSTNYSSNSTHIMDLPLVLCFFPLVLICGKCVMASTV